MSDLGDVLLAPEVRPFAVAAAIMATLGGIELLSMLVGFSIGELFGKDIEVEADSHNALGGLFLWINARRPMPQRREPPASRRSVRPRRKSRP